MEVVFPRCAGLDVHKKTVVACALLRTGRGTQRAVQTFGTTTADLLALQAWLTEQQVTHVAMESTASYWKPVFNLLESSFTTWLVNPAHIKAVPGRKTDVKDAGWEASHSAYTIVEAIGTNNGDYPWAQSSGNWSAAGTAWSDLVTSVYNQNYARVAIYGANDVESWYGSFGSWVAYGNSTEAWYQAYQNVSNSQTIIDFGSEAADEDSSAWSQQQVYDVAYGGYLDSIVMPEIYGPGQVTDWKDLYNSYSSLFFNGITAENGAGGTYSWSTAWTDLNTATGGNDVFYWAVNI